MKTTAYFTEMVKGIIADAYDARNIGEWHALFNWYDETKSDKVAHDTFADILSTNLVEAMAEIYNEIEKEIAEIYNEIEKEIRV